MLPVGVIILLVVVGVLLIIGLFTSITIVHQTEAFIIERVGKYRTTLDVGWHWILPFFDRVVKKVSLKEHVADFKPQPVITKDNVTIQIDTVVYYQITDAKLYTYGVSNPMSAIENLTATTLRNIIGELELDATLTSRDVINSKMRIILDEATDPWGIKVRRVELKNIIPPRDIQEAMEKQMRAERERREKILQAEGEKKSAILIAEGNKEAVVLEAEAKKDALILEAEAKKQALIAEAEGISRSIELINNAKPTEAYLKLKGYEALEKVADGQSTKLILPTELAGLTSAVSSVVTAIDAAKDNKAKK